MKVNKDRVVVSVLACFLTLSLFSIMDLKHDIKKTQDVLKDTRTELTVVQNNYGMLQSEHNKTVEELEELKILHQDLKETSAENIQKIQALQKENADLKKQQAAMASKKEAAQPSRGSKVSGRTIYMTATAYTANCRGCSGTTTTGLNLRANPGAKVIAVDPRIIPLGSKVYVEGYGYAIAADTGGAIHGYIIDIFIPSHSDAIAWGRKKVQVTVLD